MTTIITPDARTATPYAAEVVERLRVLSVAGIAVGVIVAGVGSRLAMFLLRLTSPSEVVGVTSDDGFTIGRVTLGGSYGLLALGAAVGIIGAAAYRAVAPWLIGPQWFRRFTVAAASGAVVGSMLVHADGIDFVLLKPTWFAIALFVALPALFGLAMSVVVDRVASPDSATRRGRWRWILPVALVVAFPLTAIFMIVATVPRPVGLVVRSVWLLIAVAGLFALVGDIRALA
jgi:hypothetical protein